MRGFEEGRITGRTDITPVLAVFRIATERSIDFIPGQFVRLGVEAGGRIRQRSYSIVSAPGEGSLEFLVELVPGGLLTPELWKLGKGDTILIHPVPSGIFTLDRKGGFNDHLLVASLAGIAPYLSMLRAHAGALRRGAAAPFRFLLIHEGDTAAGLEFYRPELEGYAREGWLLYVPTIEEPGNEASWNGETGTGEDLIRKYADGRGFANASCMAYACGHPLLVEGARGVFRRARFPETNIITERYFTIRTSLPEPTGTIPEKRSGRRESPPRP